MSTLLPALIACPLCGDLRTRDVAVGLHGDDLAAMRAAIFDGSFQRVVCDACHFGFRVEAPSTYLDLPRGHFIMCFAASDEARWRELEGEVQRLYDANVVDHAPPYAQELVGPQWLRTVFGLPALREKLVVAEHDLDDRVVEVLKLELIRTRKWVFDPARRPRLRELTHEALVFEGWLSERVELAVPRAAYDHIARSELHRASIERVGAGSYVDLGRVMVGSFFGVAETFS